MKLFTSFASFLLLGVVTAYVGPCYNHADPDSGIGNYCYCEGDGLCYFDDPSTGCDPPAGSIACP
ncbi:hypothetical protein F4779DRAFT_618547 [Xylariaceae sp. FL0662B]|nr:hypothetical protein F4779DRAFT_618547 [Xylariaceae sp. FL0662B]